VFYPNYFRWFDQCTSALFESAGLPLPTLYRDYKLRGCPLLDVRATFSTSVTFGDDLDAESSVIEWNTKTLKIQHRFHSGETLVVDGWELRICAISHPENPTRIKAAPVPEEVRRRLG
jgi:4-hydroxybenzoyl-CoA thioesterase